MARCPAIAALRNIQGSNVPQLLATFTSAADTVVLVLDRTCSSRSIASIFLISDLLLFDLHNPWHQVFGFLVICSS
jgi:hypothetical protein